MKWLIEHKVEVLLTLIILGLIVLVMMAQMGNCSHGHHRGICGREYKSGKMQIKQICECVKDHY